VSTDRVLAGRYELGRMIGRGGMAEVFAAHDRLLDREVAVKVLRDRFREDATFTARFSDEARNVARLSHPNLVVVFDTGVDASSRSSSWSASAGGPCRRRSTRAA
jgi:eukaryotic-like serine/threonine-protein kinase